jgi:hypothetical protein
MFNPSRQTFQEPSDQQLSQLLYGTPVISFRPEDLVHFSPDARNKLSPRQQEDRLMDLFNRVCRFYPPYPLAPKNMDMLSSTLSAAVHTYSAQTPAGTDGNPEPGPYRPALFVLMRPSLQLDSTLLIANAAHINPAFVTNPVDMNISRRIMTWHEFGHMHTNMNKIDLPNLYHDELVADYTALKQVGIEEGNDIIKPYILSRALAGFLREGSKYWLAPHLTRIFECTNGNPADATLDIDQEFQNRVWASYAELRLRTVADIGLNDNLNDCSSEILQSALIIWDLKADDRIPDPRLRHYCQILDKVRDDPDYNTHTEDILHSLARIRTLPQLASLTRTCAEQILEAGRMYCPRITPRP